jgi:serine/threonine protein kinase
MVGSNSEFYVGPFEDPDKYRLVHQVGSGGEAQLWRAELNVSGTWEPVAVKSLRPDRLVDIDQWKARWSEQAEVLRFIRHPGVVGVREHFEGGPMHYGGEAASGQNVLYLVMNWVDGVTLRDWVPQHQTPTAQFEALRYLAQIGDVLDWLHSGQATPSGRPVIHADVTPANVIVTDAGQAVLVDFGLIRLAAGSSTVVEGTRGYMAPEVLASGSYSPASDRYSFGALTYFTLTGANPPVDLQSVYQGFSQVPAVAAQPGLAEHLMQMFNPDPVLRPGAGEWIRFFRVSGTTSLGTTAGLAATAPGAPVPTPEIAEADHKPSRKGLIAALVAIAVLVLAIGGYALAKGSSPQSTTTATSKPSVSVEKRAKPTTTTTTSTTTTNPSDSTSTSISPQNGNLQAFFLSDQQATNGTSNPTTGPVTINGQLYPHSISNTFDACDSQQTVTEDYNLGRQYKTLTATIGLDDSSGLNDPVQFDVYLDTTNHPYSQSFIQGQSAPISIPVTGVLTLILTVTYSPTTSAQNGTCSKLIPAWGNAQVQP